jgi:hypothetical protein
MRVMKRDKFKILPTHLEIVKRINEIAISQKQSNLHISKSPKDTTRHRSLMMIPFQKSNNLLFSPNE